VNVVKCYCSTGLVAKGRDLKKTTFRTYLAISMFPQAAMLFSRVAHTSPHRYRSPPVDSFLNATQRAGASSIFAGVTPKIRLNALLKAASES